MVLFSVYFIIGCCFVTFYTRKAALKAQDALHNVKTLVGVSISFFSSTLMYTSIYEYIVYLFVVFFSYPGIIHCIFYSCNVNESSLYRASYWTNFVYFCENKPSSTKTHHPTTIHYPQPLEGIRNAITCHWHVLCFIYARIYITNAYTCISHTFSHADWVCESHNISSYFCIFLFFRLLFALAPGRL